MVNRRLFVLMLLLGFTAHRAVPAMAGSDDDHEGEHSGGGKNDGAIQSVGENSGDSDDDNRGKRGGDGGGDRGGNDDLLRRQVRDGKVEPLGRILAKVRRHYGGQIVRVRLSGQGSKQIYNIRVIDPGNQLIEVRVNASTGIIVLPSGIY